MLSRATEMKAPVLIKKQTTTSSTLQHGTFQCDGAVLKDFVSVPADWEPPKEKGLLSDDWRALPQALLLLNWKETLGVHDDEWSCGRGRTDGRGMHH